MSGIGLQQNLSLGQTLSPQMQQSLHLLQAPALELRALVQQELEHNPLLEESPTEAETTDEAEDWERELEEMRQHDEDWRDFFSQNQRSTGPSKEAQEKRQFLFDSQIEQETLGDHLLGQLILQTNRDDLLRVGEEIIGNIDTSGFLTASLGEITAAAGVPIETAQEALNLIQTFHPPGVGARDLRECLLIQLRQRGKENQLEWKLVHDSLAELGRKRFRELARLYDVSPERIQEAASYIGKLQPKPGAAFAPDEPQNVVVPEAAIVLQDGRWVVQLNEEPVPRLRISDTYKDLLGQANTEKSLNEYLRERIRAGKFLIKCIHQRQDTIRSILEEIVARQTDFLHFGISHLKPLTMNQVAQVVGVHETTVSRAIANKYVQTPWGIFPIKFFFTSGYQTSGGETLANTSIKDTIRDLVEREDPKKPLSDAEIVQIFKEQGIDIARRTVAKYRAELNILPSNLRRQF
ncbi:MAG: RNA polymerase factor sigma-54 [Candidatus Methylacidiphilales bacterium]